MGVRGSCDSESWGVDAGGLIGGYWVGVGGSGRFNGGAHGGVNFYGALLPRGPWSAYERAHI